MDPTVDAARHSKVSHMICTSAGLRRDAAPGRSLEWLVSETYAVPSDEAIEEARRAYDAPENSRCRMESALRTAYSVDFRLLDVKKSIISPEALRLLHELEGAPGTSTSSEYLGDPEQPSESARADQENE